MIAWIEVMGLAVTHVYGLTETYGPYVLCEPQRSWGHGAHPPQGAPRRRVTPAGEMRVVHPVSGEPMAKDGKFMGEIVLRGNVVMKGYLKNPAACAAAMAEGGGQERGSGGVASGWLCGDQRQIQGDHHLRR